MTTAGGDAPPRLPPRYLPAGLLGRGGMGEVWRVRDGLLWRTVAMKVLREATPSSLEAFREEARVVAQLQHPGVVPVLDLGALDDGRLWFTMPEIHGETLHAWLRSHHTASGRSNEEAHGSSRHLLDVLRRVAQTLGYAHARGVVHRDVKPGNVMLGSHGEVLVLDWGLATVRPSLASEVPLQGQGTGERGGTPGYVAPEQARGEEAAIGPWSDVWALGAVLYVVLTGRRPYEGGTEARLRSARAGAPVEAPSRHGPVDPDLEALCLQCLDPRTTARPQDGADVAHALGRWLDGDLHRQRANEALAGARAALDRARALHAEAAARESDAGSVVRRPGETEEALQLRRWDEEDAVSALRDRAEAARDEGLRAVDVALHHAPGLPAAQAVLADELVEQHRSLERAGRDAEAAAVEARLRVHARGRHARYLTGDGALTLVTDVPAEVEWFGFETVGRRRVPVSRGVLGVTPLVERAVPRGHWLLVLRAAGRVPVRYPVRVDRLGHWDGVRPGTERPAVVAMPRPEELASDDIYVPAGWFVSSNDSAQVSEPSPRRRLWCDAFVVGRVQVTNARYLGFLDALVEAADPQLAACIPGQPNASAYQRGPDGRFRLGGDPQGDVWHPDHPVLEVPWSAANAFADWEARRTGRAWRLPWDLEWEKAARGVDGWVYPWGTEFVSASWARLHRPGGPVAVGTRPIDTSVYGVMDVAGNAGDWTADPRPGGQPTVDRRVVAPRGVGDHRYWRGGSWNSGLFFGRSDLRRWLAAVGRSDTLSFRLARPWEVNPPRPAGASTPTTGIGSG